MKYLKQKVDLITSIIKDIDSYISKLSPMISQSMPTKILKIKKNKDFISDELGKIESTTDEMGYFIRLEHIHHFMKAIYDMFNTIHQNKFLYSSDKSDTYKNEVNRMYEKLSIKYVRTFSAVHSLDKKIINELGGKVVEKIKTSPEKLAEFKLFRNLFHENLMIINLYEFVCDMLIKFTKNTDRDFLYKLFDLIEEDKDKVLESGQLPILKKIKKNPLIKSFGLIPNGSFMTPSEISMKFFSQRATSNVFEKISKKNKIGIIILNKITYLPTVSSIETLLERTEVEKYFQPPEVGVTTNTVSKYNTIQFLEKGRGWNFSVDIVGDIESNQVLVLETFNGKIFRNLNLWITKKYTLNQSMISGFMKYIKRYKSNKFYPSRCDYYNDRLSNNILKNIYFPKQISISMLTEESTELDARYLRNIMTSQMIDTFKKTKKIKNNTDMGRLIKSDTFSDIFSKILVNYYDRYSSRKIMKRHSFSKSAILIDFLYQLKELTKQFKKEMQVNFNEIKLTEESYMNSQKIFEEVLGKSLSVIVVDKKNLYQAMLFKDKLLSI